MKHLPTLTLMPVQHGECYVSNGRLYRWNAIAQRGEMILVIDEYPSVNKEVAV